MLSASPATTLTSAFVNVVTVATLSASPVILFLTFLLCVWCWRADRRLRLLESAAHRAALEAMAVPQLIDDREMLELTVPRFIGSPFSPVNSAEKRSP